MPRFSQGTITMLGMHLTQRTIIYSEMCDSAYHLKIKVILQSLDLFFVLIYLDEFQNKFPEGGIEEGNQLNGIFMFTLCEQNYVF